ncbi:MAG: acyltransferase-like protein [Bryobacterales bacterium]|jgi:exopolysaccharide production protein ExoZ|nr:acyltransferase-like protein [Bryobacterales bacterium]
MLFVFFTHFGPLWTETVGVGGAAHWFVRIIEADATFGSSCFMMLSGFFAYGTLRRRSRTFGNFLAGRLRRLYPLYVIMVVIYIAGCFAFPSLSKLPTEPLPALLFIVETLLFLPGVFHIRLLLDHAWTLSFIVLFYFVEGAAVALFTRWQLSRLSRFGLIVLAGAAWAVAGDWLHCWEPRTAAPWVGMALWEGLDGMSTRVRTVAIRLNVLAVVLAVVGGLARTMLMLHRPDTGFLSLLMARFLLTTVTLFSFVWFAYLGPQWWRSVLSLSVLRSLGAASYSYYLTHGFVVKFFRFILIPWMGPAAHEPAVFWTSQFVGIAMSVALARLVFLTVEEPIARFHLRSREPREVLSRVATAA